jgi:hypothetical protein
LLRNAVAAGVVLLLVSPALAAPADVGATVARGTAADPDKAVIRCMATVFDKETSRYSDDLTVMGTFMTACDAEQTRGPIWGDPSPPPLETAITANVQYCSYTDYCKTWSSSTGVEVLHPSVPDGGLAEDLMELCEAFLWPCAVSVQHWHYSQFYREGGTCYNDCTEGGVAVFRSTHLIAIPEGTGYHLAPAHEWADPHGSCVAVGEYYLRCETFEAVKVPIYEPPVPEPVEEPVKEVQEECDWQMGEPACNP